MQLDDYHHIYNRVGFGVFVKDEAEEKRIAALEKKTLVSELFAASTEVEKLEVDLAELNQYLDSNEFPDKKELRKLFRKSTDKVKELNYAWLNRLFHTKALLREKMTLFWANHFVCRDTNILHIQEYNHVLRTHALGDFKTFLLEVSKSASMLKYLNTKQNRVQQPNENFARELMELFTLGRDQYTENDIKEAARAFTGWNHDFRGDFRFRRRHHDYGVKTFLGKTGAFDGEAIIAIILEQRQCAKFICEKLYRFLVNEKLNETHIEAMTSVFYKDYDISKLLNFVLLSDWFYDEVNKGAKIKSPIEFLVGLYKVVPMKFEKEKELFVLQKLLGQTLLFPPNVAGWTGGRSWIDPNTLMLRLKLPSILLNNGFISLDDKGMFEDSFDQFNRRNNRARKLNVTPYWDDVLDDIYGIDHEILQQNLLSRKVNKGTQDYINQLNPEQKKDYIIQLMSLPEYQLC